MKMQSINRILGCWLPLSAQDYLGALRRYSWARSAPVPPYVVAKIDGSCFHGGLCDRWKGLVSLYAYCKATGRDFRMVYTYPFDLTLFQVPNMYDWRMGEADLGDSICRCRMLRLVGEPTFNRLAAAPQDKQLHCYANRDWVEQINERYGTHYRWGELFEELFRPSDLVQQALQGFGEKCHHPYIAVAFRMQNLLGDYPEYAYQPVSEKEQEVLLEKCISYLRQLHEQSSLPILVTSDSARLTQEVQSLPYIWTNLGAAAHVDTVKNAPEEQYLKSFVDFYLLAGAEKVICAGTKQMYPSDFPKYAAMVYQHPFERAEL